MPKKLQTSKLKKVDFQKNAKKELIDSNSPDLQKLIFEQLQFQNFNFSFFLKILKTILILILKNTPKINENAKIKALPKLHLNTQKHHRRLIKRKN